MHIFLKRRIIYCGIMSIQTHQPYVVTDKKQIFEDVHLELGKNKAWKIRRGEPCFGQNVHYWKNHFSLIIIQVTYGHL